MPFPLNLGEAALNAATEKALGMHNVDGEWDGWPKDEIGLLRQLKKISPSLPIDEQIWAPLKITPYPGIALLGFRND